jgi:putative DNA primase/helicase
VDSVINHSRTTTTTTDDNISDNNLKANRRASFSNFDKESLLAKLKQEGVNADINGWIDYWYYIRGVNVLPAFPKMKYPNVEWKEWQDKSTPPSQVNEWKKKNLFKGLIIVPGKVWRGENQGKYLTHIDFDKKEAIEAFCTIDGKTSPLEKLAEKLIVEQHKDNLDRAHLLFYSPIPFPQKINDGITGIEVKGDGKHGVACCSPSTHENGYKYEILGTLEPITLSEREAQQLMQHIQNICRNKGTRYVGESSLTEEIKQSLQNLKINNTISISDGSRHNTMLPIADSLLARHIGKKDVAQLKAFFDRINNENCKPPLKDAELTSIWNDAIKFVGNTNNLFSKSSFSSSNQLSNTGSKGDDYGDDGGKTPKEATEDENDDDGALIEQAAEEIRGSHHFITIEESQEILVYQNGVYVEGGNILIDKLAEEILGYKLKNYTLSEIRGHIIRRTYKSRKDLDKDLNIINLQNGLYDIRNDELEPHTPDYLSINQKPIFFDRNKRPKLFVKFLKEVLYPSEIRTAIEVAAYTFLRDCPFEHYFKLHGQGANGKSVFTGLLTKIHGEKNVSNVSLLSLTDNRFALSDLEYKDVNIDTELSTNSDVVLKDTSILKKLTGGRKQPIRIESKYQKAYDAYIHAKLFFNANTIIQFPNATAADYRREIIISFPNTFEGEMEDPHLLDKLSSMDEVSGIFNVLMRALRNILRRKRLHFNEKTIDERRLKHERSANPVKAFVEEAILKKEDNDITEEDYITKEDLYYSFEGYCNRYKIAAKTMIAVGRELKKLGWKEARESKGETRKTCWVGIRLKPEYVVKVEQQQLVI